MRFPARATYLPTGQSVTILCERRVTFAFVCQSALAVIHRRPRQGNGRVLLPTLVVVPAGQVAFVEKRDVVLGDEIFYLTDGGLKCLTAK